MRILAVRDAHAARQSVCETGVRGEDSWAVVFSATVRGVLDRAGVRADQREAEFAPELLGDAGQGALAVIRDELKKVVQECCCVGLWTSTKGGEDERDTEPAGGGAGWGVFAQFAFLPWSREPVVTLTSMAVWAPGAG